MSNKKIPLILFSGGLDSTYLLQQQLEITDVDVLYVDGHQSPHKAEVEKKHRQQILKYLQMNSKFQVKRQYEVDIKMFTLGRYREEWKFQQPHQWIMGALQTIDHTRHSELMIAYVTGDQINYHCGDIMQAWNSLQYFSKREAVPVSFPLIYLRKTEILAEINPAAFAWHWVCELPRLKSDTPDPEMGPWIPPKRKRWDKHDYEPCGKCTACQTSLTLQEGWKIVNHYPDYTLREEMTRRARQFFREVYRERRRQRASAEVTRKKADEQHRLENPGYYEGNKNEAIAGSPSCCSV